MPDNYLTVNDFLAYDKQLTGKLGRIGDTIADVREQVSHLHAAFTDYRAETDAFRIQTRQDFAQVNQRLAAIEQVVTTRMSVLEQTMTAGFDALFAHLGILPPR